MSDYELTIYVLQQLPTKCESNPNWFHSNLDNLNVDWESHYGDYDGWLTRPPALRALKKARKNSPFINFRIIKYMVCQKTLGVING